MKDINELYEKMKLWSNSDVKSFGLIDLFSTKEITNDIIKKFLELEENKVFFRQFYYMLTVTYDLIYDDNIFTLDEKFIEKNIKIYRLLVKCICVYAIIDEKINHGGSLNGEVLSYENMKKVSNVYSDTNTFFRGQSNYSWGVVPSIFRNYIFESNASGEVFDLEKMFKKYSKYGLIDKYNKTIAVNKINKFEDINYNFISYMQHSLSYSPLIDITSKFEIGLQFALGNKANVNDFYSNAAALFAIDAKNIKCCDNETEINRILRTDFNVVVLNKKIIPGTYMDVNNTNGTTKKLNFTTIKNIIQLLTPKYLIISNMQNDRMKYQHGNFILFYDYVLVNGMVMFSLNKNFNVSKYKINVQSKESIYNEINEKFSQYSMDYLLNPYDYFNK